MNNWTDFFKVNGEYAIRNLTVFIGIINGSLLVDYLAMMDHLKSEIFITYMLASGGVYSFGKWQDEKSRRSQIDSTAEPDQTTNTTTINQPDKVNLGPTDKVTVSSVTKKAKK